jgi:tight adherence protein B
MEQFVARFVNLRTIVEQAGAPCRPSTIVLVAIVLAVAVGLVLSLTLLPMGAVPLGALLVGSLPFLWLLVKRRQRLKKFERQLPEAMELLGRSLRAGHSLSDGIRLVGEEMPQPIGGEFSRCYEQQNLGRSLEDTLEEMAVRIPSLDVRFFATSVLLQRQTGGDMAEILDKIGRLIRERFQIRAQVAALTGEGRLSGIVLLAMPVLLAIYMYLRDPEYLRPLLEHPLGQRMTISAAVLQIVGAIAIKRIVNIKV